LHIYGELLNGPALILQLGGTIGTGLFVGSGQTLARGGPAFLLACFVFVGYLVFGVVTAITEVGSYLPTPGSSMNLFAYRYANRSLGFSLGYLYFYSLGILVPYEITAAGLVIDYWNPPTNVRHPNARILIPIPSLELKQVSTSVKRLQFLSARDLVLLYQVQLGCYFPLTPTAFQYEY
jgi:amino acid permease